MPRPLTTKSEAVRALRKRRRMIGKSLQQCADEMGIRHRQSWSAVESGGPVSWDRVQQMAEVIDLKFAVLLTPK